jgi:DNA-directed RNA polymerase subunit RPC12/RpoP
MSKIFTCVDCGKEFTFTAGEEEFYSSRKLSNPKRCRACREKRRLIKKRYA